MNVTAKVEVILSAGVINTPQLLLNSGIGDKSALAALNIPLVHNLPSVGKNLTEHPAIPVTWNTKIAVSDPDPAFEAAVAQWNNTRTGRLVMAVANHVGWFRMNESDPTVAALIKEFGDPAPGPKSPHIELLPTMVCQILFIFNCCLTQDLSECLHSRTEFCKCDVRS